MIWRVLFSLALLIASYGFMPEGPLWRRICAATLAMFAGMVKL